MRIRLAIISISIVRDVQNMPRIHTAACHHILLSSLKGCDKGALL